MIPILLAAIGLSQSIHLYSEFRRIGLDGEIVSADRGGTPREILSPAVSRNAFTSFHLFVNVPPGKGFELHIAQNPDKTVLPTVYRELHKDGFPDLLETATVPIQSKGPSLYWLDIWVPPSAPPSRARLEAQLHVDGRWIIYPLELRIKERQVPKYESLPVLLPALSSRADASAISPWRAALCGEAETPAAANLSITIRSLIRRNALQDLALAGADATAYRDQFCGSVYPANPEWYLRLRDRIKEPPRR